MIFHPLIPAQAGIQGPVQRAGSPPEFTPDAIGGGDERSKRFRFWLIAIRHARSEGKHR